MIDLPGLWRARAVSGRVAAVLAGRLPDVTGVLLFVAQAFYYTIVDVIVRLKYRKTVVQHISDIMMGVGAYVMGVGLVFVMSVMALFIGATIGFQGYFSLQLVGAESYLGVVVSLTLMREVGPIVAGLALAAQVGSAYTAELGAMRISEEIDALEAMAIKPFPYLISTRVVAALIGLVPVYLMAIFACYFGTRTSATLIFGMSPGVFDHYFTAYLPAIDIFYSVLKVAVFAVVVVLIHAYYGYNAAGGPVGVGQAAGRAIKQSIMALILVNLLLSYLFWGQETAVRLTT